MEWTHSEWPGRDPTKAQPLRPHSRRTTTVATCHYCGQIHEALTYDRLVVELGWLGWSEVSDAALAQPGNPPWQPGPRRNVFVCGHCLGRWHRERRANQRPRAER